MPNSLAWLELGRIATVAGILGGREPSELHPTEHAPGREVSGIPGFGQVLGLGVGRLEREGQQGEDRRQRPGAPSGRTRPPGRMAGSGVGVRNGSYGWTYITSWVAPGPRAGVALPTGEGRRAGASVPSGNAPSGRMPAGGWREQRYRGGAGPTGRSGTDSWGLKGARLAGRGCATEARRVSRRV